MPSRWSPFADRPRSLHPDEMAPWVEPAARAGYAAKGVVYAVIGFLALRVAVAGGGNTGGTREALREVAAQPFGGLLVGLLGVGLAGYVAWRLVQAVLDPEHGEDGWKRRAMRAFYLGSAVLYALLAFYALDLMFGAAASGSSGGSTTEGGATWLMGSSWGPWVLGAIGIGIVMRGGLQFFKAYTAGFRKRIRSFQLGPARSSWVLAASRIGLTARGIIFCIIGSLLVHGSFTRDASEARGLQGVLELLRGEPWLLGAIGLGVMGYAVYQWVKARYRLIGTG